MLRSAADVPAEGVEVVSIYASPSAEILGRVARHQVEQHATVTVQRVHELDEAGKAFSDFAAGTLGKLIIAIN